MPRENSATPPNDTAITVLDIPLFCSHSALGFPSFCSSTCVFVCRQREKERECVQERSTERERTREREREKVGGEQGDRERKETHKRVGVCVCERDGKIESGARTSGRASEREGLHTLPDEMVWGGYD